MHLQGLHTHRSGCQLQEPKLVLCTHTTTESRDGCWCGSQAGASTATLAGASVVEENREELRQLVSMNAKTRKALGAQSCKSPWCRYWLLVSSVVKTAGMKQTLGVCNKVFSDRDARVHSICKGCWDPLQNRPLGSMVTHHVVDTGSPCPSPCS